jgi:hypothetical protein
MECCANVSNLVVFDHVFQSYHLSTQEEGLQERQR